MWTDKSYLFAQVSVWGAARAFLSLPVEHPLDALKTACQLKGNDATVREVTVEIFQKKGLQGFYAGFRPNTLRVVSKQLYRMPLTLGLSNLYDLKISHWTGKKYPILASFFTGFSLASLETFIICPLERTKVWLMSYPGQNGWQVLKQKIHSKKGFMELFRGLNAVYAKQMSSWVSFLIAEEVFRGIACRYTQSDKLSTPALLAVSLGVGGVNTLAAYPFDLVKTHQQRSQSPANQKVWSILATLFKKHGFKGMYTGWKIRVVQYMVQSCFTVTFLDKFKQRLRQLDQK
jgi:hypothetical protein